MMVSASRQWNTAYCTCDSGRWEQKFSTDTEVKQATSTTAGKMFGYDLLHVFEKCAGHCKTYTACEGWYFKNKSAQASESSDSK
jgi:hypothetical protein